MQEICCKLIPKKNVCKGEGCKSFDGCPYKNECGAKKIVKEKIEGEINGNNYPVRSKKMQAILNSMDFKRYYRR